jgi:hypothetical protein
MSNAHKGRSFTTSNCADARCLHMDLKAVQTESMAAVGEATSQCYILLHEQYWHPTGAFLPRKLTARHLPVAGVNLHFPPPARQCVLSQICRFAQFLGGVYIMHWGSLARVSRDSSGDGVNSAGRAYVRCPRNKIKPIMHAEDFILQLKRFRIK